MAKLSLSLVVVVLAVSVDVALSGFASSRDWNQSGGGRPGFGLNGFGDGKCSDTRGVKPDPKSGCCGRHTGSDGDNQGGDNHDIGNQDNNDYDHEVDSYDPINPGESYGPGSDDGGNNIGDGGNDNDNTDDIDNIGNIFDPDHLWGGHGGIEIGGIGNDIDNIFIDSEPWEFNNEYRFKRSTDKNASDVAPDKYIIAGRSAGIAQYPWLVHLVVKIEDGTIMIGCGGSLVSSRHVITAAHCLAHDLRQYEDVLIFLSEYNTNTFPTDCVGRQCIKNVVMHPDKIAVHEGYEPGMLHDDIGMMRLKGSAPYTDFIRPICLPTFNINTPRNEGTPLAITGWGQTENGQSSSVKLHTQVQLVAPGVCREHYPELTEGQLCAAGRNRQDTCMGDSGGPIMAEHDGNFYLVGLVSGKRADAGCGSSVPTIYTNVFAYMRWIENFMKN